MEQEYHNNIRYIRVERGYTQDQLAGLIGTSKDQISKLERGQRNLTQRWMMHIARALQVEPAQLLPESRNMVPMVGYVGAGTKIMPFDDHAQGSGLFEIEAPAGMHDKSLVAVEVRGESMLPFIKEGWHLFYTREYDGVPQYCIGQLCIVKLENDEMLIKEVRHGSRPHYYDLHSYNAQLMPDMILQWAAPVLDIRPRIYTY